MSPNLRSLLVVLLTAAFFLVVIACEKVLDESLTDLEAGDCVGGVGLGDVAELDTVDCSEPGAFRVTNTFAITDFDSFPGFNAIDQIADSRCALDASLWLVPTEESWNEADDRLVVCFAE